MVYSLFFYNAMEWRKMSKGSEGRGESLKKSAKPAAGPRSYATFSVSFQGCDHELKHPRSILCYFLILPISFINSVESMY